MDESALQERLHRIERRQHLVIALLVVPYLFGIAELFGYWIAGALYAVVGLVAFVTVAIDRRRDQRAAEQ